MCSVQGGIWKPRPTNFTACPASKQVADEQIALEHHFLWEAGMQVHEKFFVVENLRADAP
jgi:hypothetical protein